MCRWSALRKSRFEIVLLCLSLIVLLLASPSSSIEFDSNISDQGPTLPPNATEVPNAPNSNGTSPLSIPSLPPDTFAATPSSNDSTPSNTSEPLGPRGCIGSAPLRSAFICDSNGYWTSNGSLTIGSGGLVKTLSITGPTLIIGTVTVKKDGKVTILLPVDDLEFPRLEYAMLRSTECITIEGSLDVYAKPAAIISAGQSILKKREFFLFDSPGCDVFPLINATNLPFNDTLANQHLPRCTVVKARIDVINDSIPADTSITDVKGNASRRYIAAYVTWYRDCLPFYTRVLIPSIFGAMLAIILLILVPMVFKTPKCCLDPKELDWKKKRKQRHEEEQKAILKEKRRAAGVSSDEESELEDGGDYHAKGAEDLEKGDKKSSNSKQRMRDEEKENATTSNDSTHADGEKKKKKWTPKAILTAPALLLPGHHYHSTKQPKKVKILETAKTTSNQSASSSKPPKDNYNAGDTTNMRKKGRDRPIQRYSGKSDDDDDFEEDEGLNTARMMAIPTVQRRGPDFDDSSSDRSSSTQRRSDSDEDSEDNPRYGNL